jgi:hypothetical protein
MILIPKEKHHNQALSMATNKSFNTKTMLENGSGQYAGNLAEVMFASYLDYLRLEHEYTAKTSYHYDFKVGDATIDIKAKQRTVVCSKEFDTHVNLYQEKSPCHYYVFTSVLIKKGEQLASQVEFMGWCSKKDYWNTCKRTKKGDINEGHKEWEDAGKLKYHALKAMSLLFTNLETHLYECAFK